jgi:hypothetical protein
VHEEIGQRLPAEKPCSHLLVTGAKQSAGGGDEPHQLRLEQNGTGKKVKSPRRERKFEGSDGREILHQSQTSKIRCKKYSERYIGSLGNFIIYMG